MFRNVQKYTPVYKNVFRNETWWLTEIYHVWPNAFRQTYISSHQCHAFKYISQCWHVIVLRNIPCVNTYVDIYNDIQKLHSDTWCLSRTSHLWTYMLIPCDATQITHVTYVPMMPNVTVIRNIHVQTCIPMPT